MSSPGLSFSVKTGGLPIILDIGDGKIVEIFIEEAYPKFTKVRVVAPDDVEITTPNRIYKAMVSGLPLEPKDPPEEVAEKKTIWPKLPWS